MDKPAGPSSHQALSGLKRRFGTGRVGHAGTLDPPATGLLVCAVGKATRLLQEIEAREKEYLFGLCLGTETTTLDMDGEVLRQVDVPDPAGIDWTALLPMFVGDLMQVPPAVSALKVDGVRSYDLARRGEAVEHPPRPVTIHALDICQELSKCPNEPVLRVRCSKGTYVRSLARDLGDALGFPISVSSLRRTAIGPWRLPDAHELLEEPPLVNVDVFLSEWPRFEAGEDGRAALRMGKSVSCELPDGDQVLAMDGEVLAFGRVREGRFHPEGLLIDAQ